MILKTTSFKNAKKNDQFLKKKNIKNRKKNFIKKSKSDYNLITIKISQNNKYKPTINLKNNIIRSNTNTNLYTLKDNLNEIIFSLKQKDKKIEQSTEISSNINTNTNNFSKFDSTTKGNKTYKTAKTIKTTKTIKTAKTNKANKVVNFKLKRGKSLLKINHKTLENINYSTLLKNQEQLLLAKGKNRKAKSSLQMPYVYNDNKNIKKYKYIGLFNTHLEKDTSLKEEINNLMLINQKIKTFQNKSRSFSFKNKNLSKFTNTSTNINPIINNNKVYKGKTLNIKIIFSYQKKKDEFVGINRLLMKQNYFRGILEKKITKIKNTNKNNEKKLKYLKKRIYVLKEYIMYFKINNIINHNLKFLNSIVDKHKYNNFKLSHVIKKYYNEIDKISIKIKSHNKKRNEIKYWYELLCKIKGDIVNQNNNMNITDMVNCLSIEDLSKGFNHLAEKIMILEQKYKNINDKIFILVSEKKQLNKEYGLIFERDTIEIKKKQEELNSLKYINYQLEMIKIDAKNIYMNSNSSNIIIQNEKDSNNLIIKIVKLFENYMYFFNCFGFFEYEEKEKIQKINKEIFIRNNKKKINGYKVENIKKNIFNILYFMEKFINILLYEIKYKKENIGKDNYKQITKNVILLKRIEKKLKILEDKENDNEQEINLIKKENKILFLPIKKVYIPYMAIKNENMKNNLKKINNKSFSYNGKKRNILRNNSLSSFGENLKLKTNNLYYLDDDNINKYNELFFE